MTILAAVLIALGSFIAVGNIAGCIGVYLRRRRGESGGFSCIPFLSLLFCVLAWLLSRDQFSFWMFLPAVLDPANWSLMALPVFLLLRSGNHSKSAEHYPPAVTGTLSTEQQSGVPAAPSRTVDMAQDPYSNRMGWLYWEDVIPPLRAAIRSTSGIDMRECQAASRKLMEMIRRTASDRTVNVFEEKWHDGPSGPMIELRERDCITWDMVQESIQRWDFTQWLECDSDSDIAFSGKETSIYLTISPDLPVFWLAIPAKFEGRELLLDSIRAISCADEDETALFEWRYLTHYEQEVVYGGDWRKYEARVVK